MIFVVDVVSAVTVPLVKLGTTVFASAVEWRVTSATPAHRAELTLFLKLEVNPSKDITKSSHFFTDSRLGSSACVCNGHAITGIHQRQMTARMSKFFI